MYQTIPLSDCTVAIDNAENILNRSEKYSTHTKATVSQTTRTKEKSSIQRGRGDTEAGRTTPSKSPLAFVSLRPQSLSLNSTPWTPPALNYVRNDPYSPCLMMSPCTPEESFYACYTEAAAPSVVRGAGKEAAMPLTAAPDKTQGSALDAPSTVAVAAHPTTPVQVLQAVTPQTPLKAKPNSPPNSCAVTPSAKAHEAPARVVRKVVRYGIDRTSGRPIPKLRGQ